MYEKDTIAAIATPAGAGGIAIVRVSGDAVREIAARVFRGWPESAIESHRLHSGRIVDREGAIVDRGLAVVMLAPRSYTGEDVLELHGHGGTAVAHAVLGVVLAAGARLAERGEFTTRAYLNGKLDLTQVEAVADLVAARTADAARVAGAQLDGALSRRIAILRDGVTEVAARLEAAIDFADEEGTDLDRAMVGGRITGLLADLEDLRGTYSRGRLLREGARIVVAGKPNVGKSSLTNRLLGEERVIVTPIPGTTRDSVEEGLDLDGIAVSLTDTAGLRDSADVIETFGIERTRSVMARADLVLLVLDGSRPLDDDDKAAAAAVGGKPTIAVLNKIDLPEVTTAAAIREVLPALEVVCTSAITHRGIDAVRSIIRATLYAGTEPDRGAVLTRDRQRLAVDETIVALQAARSSVADGFPAEIVAVHVQVAATSLAEIVGAITNDEVLDRLFREFCVGK